MLTFELFATPLLACEVESEGLVLFICQTAIKLEFHTPVTFCMELTGVLFL